MPQFLVERADVDRSAARGWLRGDEARHLTRVLRARPGDRVLLFDGHGSRWEGRLLAAGAAEAEIGDLTPLGPQESPLALELVQAVPKGERWEWLLEKATELGVTALWPLVSDRTVAQAAPGRADAKAARWRQRLVAAAKQCERGRVPSLAAPAPLGALLGALGEPAPGEVRLVLAERRPEEPFPAPAAAPRRAILAVGPEGGWTPEELREFRRAGFAPLGLGPRVLRTETAAIAGLALLQAWWGDLVAASAP